jgi:hypothetical protein
MNSEQPEPKKNKANNKPKRKVVKPRLTTKQTTKTVVTGKNATQVEDLIKQAFMRFYDKTSTRAAQNLEIKHLDNVITEYLENFILLGYDVSGQKVSIIHATSQYGKDALIEHLRTTLLNIIGGDPNGL